MNDLPSMPRVSVVIVNWNRRALTETCLASVFASDYPNFSIVLCDNGSSGDDVPGFVDWAKDEGLPWALRERNGDVRDGTDLDGRRLDVVDVGSNLGFAGACNVGMDIAVSRDDAKYVWLLNNDTTVEPDALTYLVEEMQRDPALGFCGSTVLVAEDPTRVQVLGGGAYDPWLGRTRLFARDRVLHGEAAADEAVGVRAAMDFVVGTSMLVDRKVLERCGPMGEEYFLYFEEIDWAWRCRKDFTLGFAPKSHVYHQVGGTIGSSMEGKTKSTLSDYYGIRNRILFTRRNRPACLPTVYLGLLGSIALRLVRGQPRLARMIALLALWGCGMLPESAVRRWFDIPPAPSDAD